MAEEEEAAAVETKPASGTQQSSYLALGWASRLFYTDSKGPDVKPSRAPRLAVANCPSSPRPELKLPSAGHQGHCCPIAISTSLTVDLRRLGHLCCFPSQGRERPRPAEERQGAAKERKPRESKEEPSGAQLKVTGRQACRAIPKPPVFLTGRKSGVSSAFSGRGRSVSAPVTWESRAGSSQAFQWETE